MTPPDPTRERRRCVGIDALIEHQTVRPVRVLIALGLVTVVALLLASRLTLLTGFEHLLPASRASVKELDRVAERTAGVSTVFVVLEGSDGAALRRAADALVPALRIIGLPWVGEAESGVQDAERFLAPRAGLFADLGALERLRDDVQARYDYEVAKQLGTVLDDEPPPDVDARAVRERLGAGAVDVERFPGGYYQSADGKTAVVLARSGIAGGDLDRGGEALRRIREAIARVDPKRFDPTVRTSLTGDLVIGLSEYQAIQRDLTQVGLTGALLIGGVVLLYYLRLRTLVAMMLTIGVGLAWTFGVTQLALGHLNVATGFLFTIVAGNGINFGLLFMARYLEERRGGRTLADAVRTAHEETWRPTLTACCAAAAAYGSLVVTEFRGFRDFGAIGGVGMLLCWLATYLTLPPILALMERALPLDRALTGLLGRVQRATATGVPFGVPVAALVARAPRVVAAMGALLAVAGTIATVRYAKSDPMEYDLEKLQSDMSGRVEEQRLIDLAKELTGFIGLDAMALLVDRPEQVPPLVAALEARRDAAADDEKPFKGVHALQDFVPAQQAEKIPVLLALKDRFARAKRRGLVPDETWNEVARFLPPDDLAPFTLADLPEGVARPFTERDGTRGRIVYISPLSDELTSDAHYLFRWAKSFRETRLPDGSVVLGSGRAVIYADMWAAIVDDIPPAVLVSFFATLIIVVVAFRAARSVLWVLGGLLVGAAWMTGALSLFHVKLNFLNFVALPITFGIGVDYAVNVVYRDRVERDPLVAVRQTGGAVMLCSATTILGYLALVRSENLAVRSLGVAAVVGEVTCLFGAVLVVPAAMLWWRSRAHARSRHP